MAAISSVKYKFSLKLSRFSFIRCATYSPFASPVLFSVLFHLTLSPGRLTCMDCIHGPLALWLLAGLSRWEALAGDGRAGGEGGWDIYFLGSLSLGKIIKRQIYYPFIDQAPRMK